MSEVTFPWARYWFPRGATMPLTDDGFLYIPHFPLGPDDPSSELRMRFEDLASSPCLVLLGQPGVGKSTALGEAVATTRTLFPGHQVELLKLNEFGEDPLDRELSGLLQTWVDSNSHLHLFVDNLDSAQLRIETLTYMLLRALKNHADALDRLSFRIACREAEWPDHFDKALAHLWLDGRVDRVRRFVLAPLQRADAEMAAQMSGLDAASFMKAVSRNVLGPLAAVPITLNLLISSARQDRPLARTRYDLYLDGCKALCRELDDAHARRSKLDLEHRFVVAARLAACTVFTNRYIIADDDDASDQPLGQVRIVSLADGEETADEVSLRVPRFAVSAGGIRETLATALFRGAERHTWAHQTYAEFLAGWYASTHLTTRQLRSLIFHSDGHPAPQLREVALWVSARSTDIFEDIIRSEPQLLLRSDVTISDDVARARVAGALLQQLEFGAPIDDISIRWYANLRHPGLRQQIRPYIEDRAKLHDARLAALLLAEECEVRDIQDLLANLAVDDTEAADLRVIAARAVARIGSESTKARLKKLALLPLADLRSDEKDQLKQYGVEACWPAHMSASELFKTLTAIEGLEFTFHGEYLAHVILPHLTPSDLAVALEWVAAQPSRRVASPAGSWRGSK